MKCLLGNGLPLSLTPERVKEVLRFVKSQEREFREALDHSKHPVWTRNKSGRGFYECIHKLLRTKDGREAYDKARVDFERNKPKRSERANIFRLLANDCVKKISDQEALAAILDDDRGGVEKEQDVKELFAREGAWGYMAEFIWALSIRDNIGDSIVSAIQEYPELLSFLKEVQAGLDFTKESETESVENPPPGEDEEATILVESIKEFIASLDPERLEPAALDDLDHAVQRLRMIADSREGRRHHIQHLQEYLSSWRESHSEAIAITPGIENHLIELEARLVGSGDFDHDWLKSVLAYYERALDIQIRVRGMRAEYQRAIDEDDLTLVSTLAGRLKESQHELEKAYTAIEGAELVGLLKEEKKEEQASDAPKIVSQEETADSEDEGEDAVSNDDDSGTLEETSIQASEDDNTTIVEISIPDQVSSEDIDEEGLKQSVPDEVVDPHIEKISNVVATEIGRDRFGLAYHLALATPEVFPSADVIELIACNYVTDEQVHVIACLPDLADRLKNRVGTVLKNQLDQSLRRIHAALITSAALMPARIAPGGPVAELLQSLETHLKDMPSLRILSKTVAEVSMTGLHLPLELLYEDDSVDKWIEDVKAMQKETNNWIESERQTKILYKPATKVWHRILEDWEDKRLTSIGHMFKLLAEPIGQVDINRVIAIADGWRDHDSVEKSIDRIDRECRGSGRQKKIDWAARIKLRSKIVEAIAFGDRWCSLLKARPDRRSDFLTKQINRLRKVARSHAEDALRELSEIDSPESPIVAKTKELIQRYIASFERAETDTPISRLSLSDQLNGNLFADSDLEFDTETGALIRKVSSETVLHLSEQTMQDFSASFRKAAIKRAKHDDFHIAEKTINFAVRSGYLDEDDIGDAWDAIDGERSRAMEKLEERILNIRNRLDVAYIRNGLPVDVSDRLQGEISIIDCSDTDEIRTYNDMLDQVDDELNECTERMAKKLKIRLSEIRIPLRFKKQIQNAIDHGHFQTAEDYIERAERGETLPEEKIVERSFDLFFPIFVKEYFEFSKKLEDKYVDIQKIIKHRGRSGPINATGLSISSARDSNRLVKAWFDLHAEKKTTGKKLKELLVALGFDARGHLLSAGISQGAQEQEDAEFRFDTKTIADRKIVQLPDFGSRAGGRYRIVTIRDRDTHEAIIQNAGERKADRRSPTLVIFLNPLDVDARRSLAREFSSGMYHPTIVLDEALLVFLATISHDRLSAFFDCTSAFAFTQPFDPDANEVPPEMFFGRGRERDQIVTMEGGMTHLVYGGRRLGKTALLANIAREYENGDSNQLAFLLDLKSFGIGWEKPPYEFWRVLGNHLKEYKIVSTGTVRHDSIGENIQKWLDKNRTRRILVLADEADDFLDADRGDLQEGDQRTGQRYRVLTQIKSLMEVTKRRFKVVFSGLHNVQRSARDPNTPFAHLGDPLQIGPMLPEKGDTEILNLIRGPFEALGYRFSSHDSVIGIAAATNYYPALAQQFCKELLRHLRENGATGSEEEGPPFNISAETVEHVFNSKETRDRIRNLFAWTIHLDPRYEFLTYLIARESFDDESIRPGGVTIEGIRNTALSEWYQGFESDDSYSTFEVLLEEMLGLGILREIENYGFAIQTRRFAIRTRNLRMLLGSQDEVERRYSDAKSKALSVFDAAQFRHKLESTNLSSLTAAQEGQLLSGQSGVSLVFGTRLSGLDLIPESIERLVEEEKKKDPSRSYELHTENPSSFDGFLKEVLRKRAGVHIILVDMRDSWDLGQISKTLDFVAGLDAQNRIIRPVFLGGPSEAWGWLNDPRPVDGIKMRPREIWLSPCSKGFACRWLKDREAPAFADLENLNRYVDQPWPIVVASAIKLMPPSMEKIPSSIDEAIRLTFEFYPDLISDTLEVSLVRPTLKVLSTYYSESESMTVDLISDMSGGELGDEVSPEDVEKAINWASHLGLVHRDDKGYRLDSTYAVGIKADFEK